MDPERWRRITDLFHLARARDVVARAAILDDACAGDLMLRRDVQEMLAGDDQAGEFGERAVRSVAEPPCLEPGTQFGAYRIDALIGAGGMGQVYRAHDTRLERDVAIKVLSSAMTACDPDAPLRLLREARSAASLNHPHICTIHAVGESDGQAFIVMELIEGRSLDELIPAGGLPLTDLLRYGLQIGDAVSHAHQRGIVHRDLKPANVMISDLGIAKVLDFGLAKALPLVEHRSVNVAASHTAAGLVVGTAAYMSPEQALGRRVDERSDIFSFGALLYEMAMGTRAFIGPTPMEVLDAVLHAAPEPMATRRPDVPTAFSQVIQKALAKDPRARYQRVSDLVRSLRTMDDTGQRPSRQAAIIAAATVVTVSVMWLAAPGRTEQPAIAEAPSTITDVTVGKTRIAILPFENLTGRAEDDWVGNAFSDSLTFGLQPLDKFLFVSRASIAQAYREQSMRQADRLEPEVIERLSKTLNVRYYVHGSYQRIGDRIRVVARMMEIGAGIIKAQESVTDRLDNLLQIEDALARRFASSLESGSAMASRRPETVSLKAYRAITEGRGLYASARWEPAHESFKRAVDLDSDYAEAWALLGKSYARLAAPSIVAEGSIHEYQSHALAAAKRALELDPSSYEASVALALAYRATSQVDRWRGAAHDAIAINPRFSEAYALLGDSYADNAYYGCGRDRDSRLAVSYFRQALRLDPTVIAYHYNFSGALRWDGRFDEALAAANEGIRIHPGNRPMRRGAARALVALGRTDDAERMLREAMADDGPTVEDQIQLAIIDLKRGRLEAAAKGFRKFVPRWGYFWRPEIAWHYLEAGLPVPALEHLNETFHVDPACAQWLMSTPSPYWASIRANSHARALLETYRARPPS
jgi:TolB-like protein/Tfp pilus assembly protein PilF